MSCSKLDTPEFQRASSEFIESMIQNPRKRLKRLLKGLDQSEDTEMLRFVVNEFLLGKMKVTKLLEGALDALKQSSTTVEINNILNDIEDISTRYTDILRRLYNAKDQLPVVKALKEEQQISKLAYNKMVDYFEKYSNIPLSIVINILKTHPHRNDDKTGNGVMFLPGTEEGLYKRFCLLASEYKGGNEATRNELVAVLDTMRDRDLITEKEYVETNNWLNSMDQVKTICDRLTELGRKFDRGGGDRFSIAKEMNTCMDQLVEKGAVTERGCRELRTLIHTGH